jgi:hypothetical protein
MRRRRHLQIVARDGCGYVAQGKCHDLRFIDPGRGVDRQVEGGVDDALGAVPLLLQFQSKGTRGGQKVTFCSVAFVLTAARKPVLAKGCKFLKYVQPILEITWLVRGTAQGRTLGPRRTERATAVISPLEGSGMASSTLGGEGETKNL